MRVYEAIFKDGENEGIYALSVVENPAMEDMWITLNEHPKQVELAMVDQEKRLLLGAALIPNKRIYRNVDGNEFEILFKEETIEKLAHSFFKNGKQNNSSLEHDLKLEGMSVVEGWIVEDPEKDKSANYGKTFPKGTWVTMMKVDNDEIWKKAKNGEIKGFSIDALLGLQEIKLNINKKEMTREDFIDAFKTLFAKNDKGEEVTQEELVELKSEFEAYKTQLSTQLGEKDTEIAEKQNEIETLKTQLSALTEKDTLLAEKDAEIETLKAELNKQPEAEPIKTKPSESKDFEHVSHRAETLKSRVFANLAKNVWN